MFLFTKKFCFADKFMRKETILEIAKGIMRTSKNWQEDLKKEVIGTTVLTDYTNKTYMIDDIDFGKHRKITNEKLLFFKLLLNYFFFLKLLLIIN